MRRIRGNRLAGLALLAATFSLAACGPAPSASSTAPTQGSGASAPAATPSPAKFVPLGVDGTFVSPTNNITCEVTAQEVLCETNTPYQSVTMSASGQYKTCKGVNCLSNAPEGTPTLAYGTATGTGPFRCESETTGVTCLSNGLGFRISTSGVTSASS